MLKVIRNRDSQRNVEKHVFIIIISTVHTDSLAPLGAKISPGKAMTQLPDRNFLVEIHHCLVRGQLDVLYYDVII